MIGVAALVITLSVMNGLETEVRQRIIGAEAHLRLTTFHEEPLSNWFELLPKLERIPHVIGSSPYIQNKGMLKFGKAIEGAIIKGVSPETVGQVSDLPNIIIAGSLAFRADSTDQLRTPSNPTSTDTAFDKSLFKTLSLNDHALAPRSRLPGIILGRQLAFRMGSMVGDSLIVISPTGLTGFMSTPQIKRFQVSGIFETGIFEYDDAFVYMALNDAQQLFEMNSAVTGIELRLDDMDRADAVAKNIDDVIGYPYYTRTWHEMHRTLFKWMRLEKWLYTILLSLIIIVAAFNIVSSQIMMVLEKNREIGILKAIGATQEGIMRIFLYEGLIVGFVGTLLGLILGWIVCWAQATYRFFSLPGDVYFLSYLPVRMQILDFAVVSLVALGLTLAASIYPARRAAKLNPIEVIRYE